MKVWEPEQEKKKKRRRCGILIASFPESSALSKTLDTDITHLSHFTILGQTKQILQLNHCLDP